jgi:c-di-GMP-binding flagellar brake protein YcgR
MESVSRSRTLDDQELRLWDRLELEFIRGKQTGIYVARIEDLRKDGIVINRPEWLRGEPLFGEGASCIVTYVRQICAYRFGAEIISAFMEGKKKLYLLSLPRSVKRVQRRRFVRVDVAADLQFARISDDVGRIKAFKDLTWCEVKTRNISAGGIGFIYGEKIEKGTVFAVKLHIPRLNKTFQTLASVARCVRDEDAERWFVGMQMFTREEFSSGLRSINQNKIPGFFKKFSYKEQNELVNFVFSEEIRVRQKGVI